MTLPLLPVYISILPLSGFAFKCFLPSWHTLRSLFSGVSNGTLGCSPARFETQTQINSQDDVGRVQNEGDGEGSLTWPVGVQTPGDPEYPRPVRPCALTSMGWVSGAEGEKKF